MKKTYKMTDESLKILEYQNNKVLFVNEAIKFYYSYKTAEEIDDYILMGIDKIVEAKIEKFEYDFSKRILSLISNMGIEVGMLTYMLSSITKIDDETRDTLRSKVINQMSENNSVFKYNK